MKNHKKLQPKGLRELRAYQLAKQLSHLIYEVTARFPKSEFRLIGQMRGAANSVFGNITEGYGRSVIGDYLRFCEIARGSLAELGSYLEFCQEEGLISSQAEQNLFSLYNHAWNTLGALIRSLKNKKQDQTWDRTNPTLKEESRHYITHSPNEDYPLNHLTLEHSEEIADQSSNLPTFQPSITPKDSPNV